MADVVLKGELHTSPEDLEEAKDLLLDGVDVIVLEGSAYTDSSIELAQGWFALTLTSFFWILDSVYIDNDILVDLARAKGTSVVYTRETDTAIAENVSFPVKALAGAVFYVLTPASIWTGFLTGSQLFGAYLLFLGLVLPIGIVRMFDTRGQTVSRDRYIADEIRGALNRGESVLAVVGAAHVDGIQRRLPPDIDIELRPPKYGVWSIHHLRQIALPMFKAGLVLFSMYLLAVWFAVHAVATLSPLVEGLLV